MIHYRLVDQTEGEFRLSSDTFCGFPESIVAERIESVTLETGVTHIKENAFAYMSHLKSVECNNGVVEIGKEAFRNCPKLSNVVLSESLISIPEGCFQGCKSLAEIHLPDSITQIDRNAFKRSGLEMLTLPERCVAVSEGMCKECLSLRAVTLSPYTVSIGRDAFALCRKLRYISFLRINQGVMRLPFDEVRFPATLVSIGKNAFESTDIRRVDLSLCMLMSRLNVQAFMSCHHLKAVKLSETIREIGNFCFCDCALEGTLLLRGVKKVGDGAFLKNRLSRVQFASGVKIGHYAFQENLDLRRVNLEMGSCDIGWHAFYLTGIGGIHSGS